MAKPSWDQIKNSFGAESLREFWESNSIANEITTLLQKDPIVTVISSPHFGRDSLLSVISKRLGPSRLITLTLVEKEIESAEDLWGKLHQAFAETSQRDNNLDSSVATASFRDAFINDIDGEPEIQLLYILINDFHLLQYKSFQTEVIDVFEELLKRGNVHVLLLGDLYPQGNEMASDFPFSDFVKPINLTDKDLSDDLLRYVITGLEDVTINDDARENILQISGGEPKLVQRIVLEIIDEIEERKNEVEDQDVFYASDRLLIKFGRELFNDQWLSLSFIEQLALILITLPHTDFDVYRDHVTAGLLKERLASYTQLNTDDSFLDLDFSYSLELLRRRGILYLDHRSRNKYKFSTTLLGMWLTPRSNQDRNQELFPSRLLSKGFAALVQNIVSPESRNFYSGLEAWLIQKSLPAKQHTKIKFLQDLDVSRHPSLDWPVILHLSDIQFGTAHAFSPILDDPNSLASTLKRELRSSIAEGVFPKPNIIVISGDIANWALPEEYSLAIQFIDDLCLDLKIDKSHLVVVPGNHDVNFSLSKGLAASDERNWKNNVLFHSRMFAFENFYNQLYAESNRRYPFMPKPEMGAISLHDFVTEFGLVIVGFDSACKITHDEADNTGWIWERDLIEAENMIDTLAASRPNHKLQYKIAVWHHNINQVGTKLDYLKNWNDVQMHLFNKCHFQLALHGHIHRPEDRFNPPEFTQGVKGYVFGAGAISVKSSERAWDDRSVANLSYNIIQLGGDRAPFQLKYILREAAGNPGEPLSWKSAKIQDYDLGKLSF